jgi:hypothetical protein
MGREPNGDRKPASRGRRLRVGDHVRFVLGTSEVSAQVVEDRGDIGVGGRQLVSVMLQGFGGDMETFEVAAEEVTLDTASVSRRRRA